MCTSAKRQAWKKIKDKVARHFSARKKLSDQVKKEGDWDAAVKLQKQSRDRSRTRHRNRCNICGRPHATIKKFGLCRIHLRQLLNEGKIPGARKSSW